LYASPDCSNRAAAGSRRDADSVAARCRSARGIPSGGYSGCRSKGKTEQVGSNSRRRKAVRHVASGRVGRRVRCSPPDEDVVLGNQDSKATRDRSIVSRRRIRRASPPATSRRGTERRVVVRGIAAVRRRSRTASSRRGGLGSCTRWIGRPPRLHACQRRAYGPAGLLGDGSRDTARTDAW